MYTVRIEKLSLDGVACHTHTHTRTQITGVVCYSGSDQIVTVDAYQGKIDVVYVGGKKSSYDAQWDDLQYVSKHGNVKQCWSSADAGRDAVVSVLGSDLSLTQMNVSPNKMHASVRWNREESLALPKQVHLFDES